MRSGNITAALLFLLSTGVGAAGGGAPAIAALGDGATIGLGADPEKSRSLTVANFTSKPQGQYRGAANCWYIHLKIDPAGDGCNAPGSPGDSTNAATGTTRIRPISATARPPKVAISWAVGLAHDHSSVVVDGKSVTAFVVVTAQ
jgi:hypothetical protein